MFEKYLITGATGFLGRAVLAQLRDTKAEIHALVMEGDPLARELPQNVRVITGDVCDEAALGRFFAGADEPYLRHSLRGDDLRGHPSRRPNLPG